MTIDSSPSPVAAADFPTVGHALQIQRYGLTWSGSWIVENDQLVVTSRYGSRARPVRETEDPNRAAETVLEAIVSAWRIRKP